MITIKKNSFLYWLVDTTNSIDLYCLNRGEVNSCDFVKCVLIAILKFIVFIFVALVLSALTVFAIGHSIGFIMAVIRTGIFFDPGPLAGVPILTVVALLGISGIRWLISVGYETVPDVTPIKTLYQSWRDKYCTQVVVEKPSEKGSV